MNTKPEYYFAAMNTPSGFRSYFSEIFDHTDRLFIIKGGPGTGKSRFMKDVGRKAEESGSTVEYFLCSSDPTSLDGIIIYEQKGGITAKTAVIDGTSPHAYEPKLAGVKDHILNFGDFWDPHVLYSKRNEITALTEAKKQLYTNVYSLLSVIGELDRMTRSYTEAAVCTDKLEATVGKLTGWIGKGCNYSEKVRLRGAISCEGTVNLPTYAEKAEFKYAITDRLFSADIFMEKLKKELQKLGVAIHASYSPRSPETPDAIYIPQIDTSFYIGCQCVDGEQTVSMRKLISTEKLAPYKTKLREINKLRRETEAMLQKDFSTIRTLHGEIEKIYGTAMDFTKKEAFTEKFIRENFN